MDRRVAESSPMFNKFISTSKNVGGVGSSFQFRPGSSGKFVKEVLLQHNACLGTWYILYYMGKCYFEIVQLKCMKCYEWSCKFNICIFTNDAAVL